MKIQIVGMPDLGGRPPAAIVIYLAWVALVAVWLVSSVFVKRTAERSSWALRALSVLPVAASVFLLNWEWPPAWMRLRLLPRGGAWPAVGAAVTVLGLAVALWARFTLAGNWSGMVTLKEGHELVMRGPYRWVRHPIYTGILVMYLGSAVAVGRLCGLLGFLLMLAGFWIKLRQEEALMSRVFPQAYPAYRRRVKALVPFVFLH